VNWQIGDLPHGVEAGWQGSRCSHGLRSRDPGALWAAGAGFGCR